MTTLDKAQALIEHPARANGWKPGTMPDRMYVRLLRNDGPEIAQALIEAMEFLRTELDFCADPLSECPCDKHKFIRAFYGEKR